MLAGRIREFILVAGLWLLPLTAVLWAGVAAVKWALESWPKTSPFFLGAAAVLAIGALALWLVNGGQRKLAWKLSHKYWGKIWAARARETDDPFHKPPPFRLDPETPASSLTLGLSSFIKVLIGLVLGLVRVVAPNARIWPLPFRLVTRYNDVIAVLNNNASFETAYGEEMKDMGQGTNFVLGMNGQEHAAARAILVANIGGQGAVAQVQACAAEVASALVDQAHGRMDVVADLIRRTAAETCIDYFGLEAPDPDSLADWTIAMSRQIFADPFGATQTRAQALQAARHFRAVVERSLDVAGKRPANTNLVSRLLALKQAGGITHDEIITFLTGNATGMIPTTTIGMTAIIGELLSWPMWWDRARDLARQARSGNPAAAAGARTALQDILMEAARLSPTLYPGQYRITAKAAVIAPGTLRAAKVKPGDLVMAATASALRDGRRFRNPNTFNPNRPPQERAAAEVMFGWGVHKCVGIHMSLAVMVEIAIALFSQEDLALAPGDAGKVRSAGPFPRHLEMTWKARGIGQQKAVIAARLPACTAIPALTRGLEGLNGPAGHAALAASGLVHFASFTVVDLKRNPDGYIPSVRTPESEYWLIGDINFDGDYAGGIDRIAAGMGAFLTTFALADGTIKTTSDLARFLKANTLDIRATPWGATGLQYQGSIGLPVDDIRRQKDLADFVREVVEHLNTTGTVEARDALRPAGSPPDAMQILQTVRRLIRPDPQIRSQAAANPALQNLLAMGAAFKPLLRRPLSRRLAFSAFETGRNGDIPPVGRILRAGFLDQSRLAFFGVMVTLAAAITTTLRAVDSKVTDPVGLLLTAFTSLIWVTAAASLVALILFGLFMGLLLAHEALERTDPSPPAPDLVEDIDNFDNAPGKAQNAMISVTWVKPGPFRRYTLALGMWMIGLLTSTALRPGTLGRMATVHFARWVKPPGSDALIFLSNYDGSWVSYLEDFSALAHQGVNLAWGHSRGFPTPSLMINAGCTDSDSFKRFAKRSMRRMHFWYAAYPELTLENTRRNALIHDGILRASNATEAQDWLDLLASVKRPEREIETEEVQTLLLRGLGSMQVMECGLVSLPPGANLAGWAGALTRNVSFGNEDPHPGKLGKRLGSGLTRVDVRDDPEVALFVAFTASGLGKLGVPGPQDGQGMAGLLAPFYQGMSRRERILRDAGPSSPANWKWSDSPWTGAPGPKDPVEAVILAYGMTTAACKAAIARQVAAFGLTLVKSITAPASPVSPGGLRAEPFGFADGISNPVMKGLRGPAGSPGDLVDPGEILLGYPHNRPGKTPTCAIPADLDPLDLLPTMIGATPVETATHYVRYPAFGLESGAASDHDFGRNGSFLVVRQLEQDVAGFHAYTAQAAAALAAAPGVTGASPHWVAARMVGRWRDGSPVALYPDSEPTRPDPTNDFGYADIDPRGFACPLGAHIRRSNPRDSLISDDLRALNHVSSHRILRRGRAYLETDKAGNRTEGLVFIAACADLERQFEFIQQTWIGDPSFHGLSGESDPVADNDGKLQDLSLPDGRTVRRLKGIPDFVTVRGGGYFFMPSRSALYFLADRARRAADGINPPPGPGSLTHSASPSPRGVQA